MQQNSIGLYEVLPRRIAETVMQDADENEGGDGFDDLDDEQSDDREDADDYSDLDDDQEDDILPPLPFDPREDA